MFAASSSTRRLLAPLILILVMSGLGLTAAPAQARPSAKTIAACAGLQWQANAFNLVPGLLDRLQPHGMKAVEAFGDTDVLTVVGRKGSTVWCKYVSTTPSCFTPGYEKLKRIFASSANPLARAASATSDVLKEGNDNFEVVSFIYAATKGSDGHWSFFTASDTPGLEGVSGEPLLVLFDMGALSAYVYCNAAQASDKYLRKHLDAIISLFQLPGRTI